jgi:hypothetical protein
MNDVSYHTFLDPHTLHEKCSEQQRTLHNILHWFQISTNPWLTYTCNT